MKNLSNDLNAYYECEIRRIQSEHESVKTEHLMTITDLKYQYVYIITLTDVYYSSTLSFSLSLSLPLSFYYTVHTLSLLTYAKFLSVDWALIASPQITIGILMSCIIRVRCFSLLLYLLVVVSYLKC